MTDSSELDLLTTSVNRMDPASHTLHGATEFMKGYQVGCAGLHAHLRANTLILCGDKRGRVDGGSMATTTNQRDLLWFYHDLSGSVPALKVADDTQHFPLVSDSCVDRTIAPMVIQRLNAFIPHLFLSPSFPRKRSAVSSTVLVI